MAATYLLISGLLPAPIHDLADLAVQSFYAHYFIAGMALYLVHRSGWSRQPIIILALSLVSALIQGRAFAEQVGERYSRNVDPVVASIVIVLIFLVMTWAATSPLARRGRPWMSVAGSVTYPLHLLHAEIGFLLLPQVDPVLGRWVTALAGIAIMALLAYATTVLVERPVARWMKRRFAPPGDRSTSAHPSEERRPDQGVPAT